MAKVTDLNPLLEQIMIESKDIIGAEASSLMLFDESTEELYFKVTTGEKGEAVKVIRLKLGEGIAGTCAKERRTIVINDVTGDDRHYRGADRVSRFETRSILATPMIRSDKLIGVIEVLNKFDGEPFTESDRKVLEFLADHAAIVIENAFLVEANMRAERLATMGRAIADLSHYIKNVLAGVHGSASLIDLGLEKRNYRMVKKAWPILRRTTDKINSLVRSMLSYSRPYEPVRTKASMDMVVEDVCRSVEESAARDDITLERKLSGDVPIALFDVDRIHDAVLNLVTNALDAVREEKKRRVTVRTEYGEKDDRILVKVEDSGPGIPPDAGMKIFEPFFSTKGPQGTGLGLAITLKSIREHGGDVLVEAREGGGTRFTITLPLVRPGD